MLIIKQDNKVKKVTAPPVKKKKINKKVKRFPRKVKRFPRTVEEYSSPNTRIIVKKDLDEETWNKWLSSPPGWIQGLTEDMEGNPSNLYDYQEQHMLDKSVFRIADKARQTGFSYVKALEALAKSHMKSLQTSIFISMNQEEANEKIRFAQAAYNSLPTEYKRTCIVDNKQSLEFEYNNKRTRIMSFAQRQPRGKGNNTDILLDEFCSYGVGQEKFTFQQFLLLQEVVEHYL